MSPPQRDGIDLLCVWLEDGVKKKRRSVSGPVVREKVAMPIKAGFKTL